MTPPRLAQSLLRRAVPPDGAGESVLGDLRQEFDDRVGRIGLRAANRWYWRQAISLWWWSAWTHPPASHHHPRGGAVFDFVGDIRHAGRVASKAPGQSLLIVATIALGIGVTTIGFSFADTVFLRGVPIAEPDRTVMVFGVDAREPERRGGIFFADFLDFRERSRTVHRLSTWVQARATVRRSGSDPARITVSRVTGDLFAVWGLRTQHGRGLGAEDDAPGAPRVAVLSDRFWREMFGGAPSAVGEQVILDGAPVEIVGVLTSEVEFGTLADIAMWVARPPESKTARDLSTAVAMGRLAPGATVDSAVAEFRALAQTLEQEHPDTNRGRQTLVLGATRALGGPNLVLVMSLLIGVTVLVVVIASVNVAGVLLARAVVRQREFALRVALGAANTRVFRQVVVEGLLLGACGAVGGLLVAEAGLRLIRSVDAEPILQQIVLDRHEVAFVAGLAVIVPLLFSLAPALSAVRLNLVSVLNASTTRMAGGHGRRAREVLVAAQLALAIALTIIGGLVARTASAIMTSPNGFDPSHLLTFTLALDDHSDDPVVRRQLVRAFGERLEAGGMLSAGVLDTLPAVIDETTTVINPDGAGISDTPVEPSAHVVGVNDAALNTLGVPLIEGRALTSSDIDTDAAVAIISLETAERHFGGARAALGRRVTVRTADGARERQIVGVTGNVRNTAPELGMPLRVWVPLSNPQTVTFVARSPAGERSAAELVRRVARELAPEVPVESLELYEQAISRRMGSDRVIMGMLVSFTAVALLFAATGLYGTLAMSANMRLAEYATRFALGAQVHNVMGLVVVQALKLVVAGLVPGLALGLLAGLAMRRLLYGVTPVDPLTIAGVVTLLAVVSVAASLAPALRASRVDLVSELRRG